MYENRDHYQLSSMTIYDGTKFTYNTHHINVMRDLISVIVLKK